MRYTPCGFLMLFGHLSLWSQCFTHRDVRISRRIPPGWNPSCAALHLCRANTKSKWQKYPKLCVSILKVWPLGLVHADLKFPYGVALFVLPSWSRARRRCRWGYPWPNDGIDSCGILQHGYRRIRRRKCSEKSWIRATFAQSNRRKGGGVHGFIWPGESDQLPIKLATTSFGNMKW